MVQAQDLLPNAAGWAEAERPTVWASSCRCCSTGGWNKASSGLPSLLIRVIVGFHHDAFTQTKLLVQSADPHPLIKSDILPVCTWKLLLMQNIPTSLQVVILFECGAAQSQLWSSARHCRSAALGEKLGYASFSHYRNILNILKVRDTDTYTV